MRDKYQILSAEIREAEVCHIESGEVMSQQFFSEQRAYMQCKYVHRAEVVGSCEV